MKKLLILLLSLLLFATPVLAEEAVDLSGMSDAELMQLYIAVSSELDSRIHQGEANRIGRGEYIVGKHIKAGTYDFVCTETDTNDRGYNFNEIQTWSLVEDSASKDEMQAKTVDIQLGGHASIILEEGMVLVIKGCSGELYPMNVSWMP